MEVCAEGGVIVQQLARRIAEDGGAALIADYGHEGTKTDTFRVRASPRDQRITCLLLFLNSSVFYFHRFILLNHFSVRHSFTHNVKLQSIT